MYEQSQKFKNIFIAKRIKTNKVSRKKSVIDLDDFDSLLDFSSKKQVKVFFTIDLDNRKLGKETFVLLRQNFLADKKDGTAKIIEKQVPSKRENMDNTLDFSMFDDLLNDFEKSTSVKKDAKKKSEINVQEVLKYLKREIRYYENKLDNVYTLENLENEEKNLFDLKRRVDELKESVNKNTFDDISDYKFVVNPDLLGILNYCKREIEEIENILDNKKTTKLDVNGKIEKNIELQREFIKEIDDRINRVNKKIKSRLHLCMLKRMMFNLFKMTIGVYMTEANKHNGLNIMVGSFLVINSISGIKEAINLKETNEKYYKYSDYTNTHLSKKENVALASTLLNKSLQGIDDLKKEFKQKFQNYKEFIDDYEEIYFKLDKLKEFINHKQNELCELSMTIKDKVKVLG